MGIVLIPYFFLAFIVWALCLIFFIIRTSKGHMASKWSIPLSFLIFAVIYALVLISWSGQKEIWALTPFFTLPFTNIILPGLLGLGAIFIPKEKRILNIIGFAICLSALISPILFIAFEGLTQANTFLDLTLTY
jgi:hypothetical protein